MNRKRFVRAKSPLGFSNARFLELLSPLLGITPVGELGRDTPLDFSSLEAARGSLLLREIFSKYDDGKPSEEKSSTTWKRFHEAEGQCQSTNKSFYDTACRDPFWISVRRRLWDALGTFDWDECARFFAFGPGATTRLTRSESFAAYKYSGIPESTSGNAGLATCAIRMVPLWNQSVQSSAETLGVTGLVSVVPGNSIIAVPKNFKTDRTIAKEPCMNIYIQKGIGRVIRNRLNRVGVDLNDQTRNQRAALQGSITGELATVDLTMASDTLSYEVVSWLLPNDWWFALEQCRSPVGVLPSGEIVNYQKFSSMGNGYTFELESLIFWAICQQVCRPNINETDLSVCVYGDDLVIPSVHYDQLVERLAQAGFTPNLKKSFASGPYRESCGKHYFQGSDITPFYVRKPVQELDRLFLVHNNVHRWGQRTEVEVLPLLKQLRELAPAKWRQPRLPDGYGDGAFIGFVDELQMDSHPHGWEYWQCKALTRSSVELEGELPVGQLIASLKASSARKVIVRGEVFSRLRGKRVTRLTEYSELHHLDETLPGLPARVGRYREITILIPRHPLTP
jgi:hypothetical protein